MQIIEEHTYQSSHDEEKYGQQHSVNMIWLSGGNHPLPILYHLRADDTPEGLESVTCIRRIEIIRGPKGDGAYIVEDVRSHPEIAQIVGSWTEALSVAGGCVLPDDKLDIKMALAAAYKDRAIRSQPPYDDNE